MDQRRVFRVLVALGVVVAAVLAGLLVTGVTIGGPCHDDLSFEPPQRTFSVEQSNGTVTVSFEDGTPITERNSARFALRVRDSETGEQDTIVVGTNESGDFPVEPGESVTLTNDSVPFALTDGDRVRVLWQGEERPLPEYCLNSRDRGTGPRISYTEFVLS